MFLEELLLVDYKFNKNLLSGNLYISYNDLSALRQDCFKVIEKLKTFHKIEIIKEKHKVLQEGYSEELYLVKADDLTLFIRLIKENELYNDVLVTSHIQGFRNFFKDDGIKFTSEFLDKFAKSGGVLIKVGKDLQLIKADADFWKKIGYEDWDYENKFQNNLSTNTKAWNLNELFNLELVRSDGKIICLSYKYLHNDEDYYLYEGLKK